MRYFGRLIEVSPSHFYQTEPDNASRVMTVPPQGRRGRYRIEVVQAFSVSPNRGRKKDDERVGLKLPCLARRFPQVASLARLRLSSSN